MPSKKSTPHSKTVSNKKSADKNKSKKIASDDEITSAQSTPRKAGRPSKNSQSSAASTTATEDEEEEQTERTGCYTTELQKVVGSRFIFLFHFTISSLYIQYNLFQRSSRVNQLNRARQLLLPRLHLLRRQLLRLQVLRLLLLRLQLLRTQLPRLLLVRIICHFNLITLVPEYRNVITAIIIYRIFLIENTVFQNSLALCLK